MRLQVKTNEIQDALTSVGKVIPKVSVVELGNVLIDVNDKKVTLIGTNMEQSVKSVIDTVFCDEGSQQVTVQFNLIKDIVALFDKNKVLDVDLGEKNIILSQGSASYTLNTLSADTFPVIPDLNDLSPSSFSLSFKDLSNLINKTSFAASQKKESKREFQCVLIHIINGEVRFVASDSTVLALEKINFQLPEAKLLIPTNVLNLIPSFSLEDSDNVEIRYVPSLISFSFKNTQIVSVLVNGDFPDYTMLVRDTSDFLVEVSKQDFLMSLKRLDVLAKTSLRRVKTVFDGNKLVVSTLSGIGKGQEEILLANSVSEKIEIAFDIGRLMDGIEHAEGDIVVLGINKSLTPVVITSKKDPNYCYIIMPQRWVE